MPTCPHDESTKKDGRKQHRRTIFAICIEIFIGISQSENGHHGSMAQSVRRPMKNYEPVT